MIGQTEVSGLVGNTWPSRKRRFSEHLVPGHFLGHSQP